MTMDFMSYPADKSSVRVIRRLLKIKKDLAPFSNIEGENVIIIEDIIDLGNT